MSWGRGEGGWAGRGWVPMLDVLGRVRLGDWVRGCTMRSNASWAMVAWGLPCEQTDRHKWNITFQQLRWRAVIKEWWVSCNYRGWGGGLVKCLPLITQTAFRVEIFIRRASLKTTWWKLNINNNLGLTSDKQGSLNIHLKLWLYVMLYLPFLE